MYKKSSVFVGLVVVLLASVVNGQIPLEIHAASSKATPGWRAMKTSLEKQDVWVSPTVRLTSADVERAELRTRDTGDPAVAVVFTEEGAKKMDALATEQMGQLIAIMLDGRLVWAPLVRTNISKEAMLTGGPGGLTPAEIQRLLAMFKVR